MKDKKKYCGNCWAWHQVHIFRGECRYESPKVFLDSHNEPVTHYPSVSANSEACCEYCPDDTEIEDLTAEFEEWAIKFGVPVKKVADQITECEKQK